MSCFWSSNFTYILCYRNRRSDKIGGILLILSIFDVHKTTTVASTLFTKYEATPEQHCDAIASPVWRMNAQSREAQQLSLSIVVSDCESSLLEWRLLALPIFCRPVVCQSGTSISDCSSRKPNFEADTNFHFPTCVAYFIHHDWTSWL